MSTISFKTQIKNIREEAIKIGFSISTINGYEYIWNTFIKWKNEEDFIYSSEDYEKFLLEHYNFDINTYSSQSKSRFQQLIRSKRILDNFNEYKKHMVNKAFPKPLYNSDYPDNWSKVVKDYVFYLKNIRQNEKNTVCLKERYLKNELSYFYQKGLKNLSDLSNIYINTYIIDTINAGNISKRRNFYVLKDFLMYLFIEDIIKEDLSVYIPKIRCSKRTKIPTYLKQKTIEELLNSIPRNKTNEKRDYAIIILAARLGLRISDILNIKLKNIDWQNNRITVIQPKTNNLNILPLSREVGWAIIDYIKLRPKCNNEYLFIKLKYPYEKINYFRNFNKYFDKIDIEVNENNKKGIHNLRHSLAKNMLDNDIPLHIISSTLGHASEDTTSNNYLKIDYKNLKKCVLEVSE